MFHKENPAKTYQVSYGEKRNQGRLRYSTGQYFILSPELWELSKDSCLRLCQCKKCPKYVSLKIIFLIKSSGVWAHTNYTNTWKVEEEGWGVSTRELVWGQPEIYEILPQNKKLAFPSALVFWYIWYLLSFRWKEKVGNLWERDPHNKLRKTILGEKDLKDYKVCVNRILSSGLGI